MHQRLDGQYFLEPMLQMSLHLLSDARSQCDANSSNVHSFLLKAPFTFSRIAFVPIAINVWHSLVGILILQLFWSCIYSSSISAYHMQVQHSLPCSQKVRYKNVLLSWLKKLQCKYSLNFVIPLLQVKKYTATVTNL